MKVDVLINAVKIDGKEAPLGDSRMLIQSPWNGADHQVELIVGTHTYTVEIKELRAALDACQCAYQFYVPRR